MKIVVLDGYTENPGDLSWDALRQFGDLTVYDRTSYEESPLIAERMQGADIVVMNKTPISRQTIDRCPDLKLIAVLATGFNVVDIDYAREKGIPVVNSRSKCKRPCLRHGLRQPVCHRPSAGGVPSRGRAQRICPRRRMGL